MRRLLGLFVQEEHTVLHEAVRAGRLGLAVAVRKAGDNEAFETQQFSTAIEDNGSLFLPEAVNIARFERHGRKAVAIRIGNLPQSKASTGSDRSWELNQQNLNLPCRRRLRPAANAPRISCHAPTCHTTVSNATHVSTPIQKVAERNNRATDLNSVSVS